MGPRDITLCPQHVAIDGPAFAYAMSNPYDSETTQLISAYTSAQHTCWLQIASVALLAYEYVITFDQEVALFWKPKITGATVLFLGTRYTALLSYDFMLTATFSPLPDQLLDTAKDQSLVALIRFPQAFSALRALAMSRMNWPLALSVFILALAPFLVNIWPVALDKTGGMNIPILGCGGFENLTTRQSLIRSTTSLLLPTNADSFTDAVMSRSCLILADVLVILVTWRSLGRTSRAGGGVGPTLAHTLMHNGTIYFVVVVVCNTLHLILTLLSITTPLQQTSQVTALTDPITTILICRFFLALQRANQTALGRDTLRSAHSLGEHDTGGDTVLRFASVVIGSIGESLTETDLGLDAVDSADDLGEMGEKVSASSSDGVPLPKGYAELSSSTSGNGSSEMAQA
ncbi:hypothetical protein VTO73DRAFT_11829 [Trametes versicolor]